MRVLLVAANTERLGMVALPYGLGLVAAGLRRAGHAVRLLDLMEDPDLDSALRDFRPEAIGISIRNIDDQRREAPRFFLDQARAVVAACRARSSAPVVLGGPGYSIFPRAALAFLGADYGIRGEGEEAFPALLDQLARGLDPTGLPGLQMAGDTADAGLALSGDLDGLPLWDEALDHPGNRTDPDFWMPVQSRRGCPNGCAYCSTSAIQGRAFRCRPPRQVAEAIAALARRGYRRFYFVDNTFNLPESQAFALCRELVERSPKVLWRCILYPLGVSEPLVRAMAEAGCVEVSLGFESGSLQVLRRMNKRFTPGEVRRTSDLLADHGIRRMGFLLLGGPGETRATVEESLAFARSLNLDGLRMTVGLRIYPGTPLARRARAEGLLAPGDDLLRPRFYLAPGLEPWIQARVAAEAAETSPLTPLPQPARNG